MNKFSWLLFACCALLATSAVIVGIKITRLEQRVQLLLEAQEAALNTDRDLYNHFLDIQARVGELETK